MKRTGVIAEGFGQYLNMKQVDIERLYITAVIHDIGKLKVDSKILNKTSKLTENDFCEIKKHPTYSRQILSELNVEDIIVRAAFEHHERMDGLGYPRGLKGSGISLLGKIISICDSFESMTGDRIYREPLSIEEALKEVEDNLNSQFDYELGKNFIKYIKGTPLS